MKWIALARRFGIATDTAGQSPGISFRAELQWSKTTLFALLLCFVVIWFVTLGTRTLIPSDEARYAEIAREMAVSGDFITLRLNGIKYFGKPPLQIWMTALAFKAFGLGEWQARLWTGMCGLLGIALVTYTGRRVFSERAGIAAGLVLASCAYWAIGGHFNSLDMALSAMMTLSLCALLLAQREGASAREQRNWMLVCWAGMALAMLTKGLVGVVLPGGVLMLYAVVSRDWAIRRRLHIVPGLLIFFIIAAPWFVLVSLQNPEFPRFFFYREHLQRFATNVHRREEAWHYFVPLLFVGILPWLGVLPQSLRQGWQHNTAGFRPRTMLLVWAVFIFFFFSMSRGKLPSYILPVFPALSLLIGCYLANASRKAIVIVAGVFCLICAIGLPFLPKLARMGGNTYELFAYRSYLPWVAGALALGIFGSLLSMHLARRGKEAALAVLAATGFLCGQAVLVGHDAIGRYKAGIDHVPAIKAELGPHTPIFAVGAYEYALPFYLGRTMTLVESAEDGMVLGLKQEPHLWIPRTETFIALWTADYERGRKAVAVLRPDMYARLRRQYVPMHVIAEDPYRVIVTNGAVE